MNSPVVHCAMCLGWTDYGLLENYYEQRLLAIMAGLNHGYVVWEEIFDNGVQVCVCMCMCV